ncbi:chloramphenicol-sensitive protein RarD [Thalassobacillus cyri]|uniref:Chloramphenicol-sensitive protein RarD n=1 Tax=Thalassobacillus cyri TaxID=571932 RepID=A0A1H4DLS2_9BACI|nr:EamA family transporter RarD [Thalassobacillus cyri]SEA73773.1 chloramphenicol-sensitive protein RarD [Thalassobacillus cyri]
MEENKLGIIYTGGAYVLWGFLPIYWKLVQEVPPLAILGHRIVWSFVFMTGVVLILRKWSAFKAEVRRTLKNRKSSLGITFASIAISINWLTYIWAVNTDHVVEASLGYYINPLVSILLGMIFFKETFTRPQWLAFMLAVAGVAYMTINFGSVPWLALLLAFSFGVYGLLKKTVDLNAIFGLAIETLIMTPIAAIYLVSLPQGNWGEIQWISLTSLLLFGAGVATAIPLLLFAGGAKRIPLSMVGFLQYIAPTIMLLIGVFLYNEPFTKVHLVSFLLIWSGLLIYTYSRVKRLRKYDQAA